MPVVKKPATAPKKNARKYVPAKKRATITKSRTATSLFEKKVQKAYALLSKARLLSDVTVTAG